MNKNIDERKLNLNTQYFHEIRDKFLEMGYSSLIQPLDGLLKYTCDAFKSTELRLKNLIQDDIKNEKDLLAL